MSAKGISDADLANMRRWVTPDGRSPQNVDVIDLIARLDAAERERDALREALGEIVTSDSPLGRNGVPSHKEIARRALKGIDYE